MELPEADGGRGRLARTALAVALGIVAIGSLRKGKRLTGALAGAGAVALGYGARAGSGEQIEAFDVGATDESGEPEETVGTDSRRESGGLRCAICGQPILVGQRRGPNENDETVHEACKESSE